MNLKENVEGLKGGQEGKYYFNQKYFLKIMM